MNKLLSVAVGVLLALLLPGAARAEPVTRTFALVVANNRSLSLALPDLQYADDDAARYYRLFHAAGAGSNVELLTTFDRTSSLLYPSLKPLAHAASHSELLRAAARLQKAVQSAHAQGERTQLYFVFAGHGEVAGGRGYLHLEDARIDGAFIEREIIEKIPADTKHVLLDSCNSFFVINPRKPGGRRWATPKDMALGFSARHPEVGLFLSTNSDEEVFEWSELESGVFSHEVRSGLTGAADVNRDGNITYAELAGFVAEANHGIPRENLRPQIFFSGPRGDQQASLFSARTLAGRRVTLGADQARIWARSESGERLVDLHKERGELTLTLPDAEAELSVFVQTAATTPNTPPTLVEHRFASGAEPIRLLESPAEPPRLAARGDQLFGSLFASPYGPAAYATFLKTNREQPEAVFGVRDDDIQRMSNYLTAIADVDQMQRHAGALALGLTAFSFASTSVVGQLARPGMSRGASIGLATAGAVLGGGSLYLALTDGPGEKARKTFEAELRAQRGNRALAFAHTEQRLQEVAQAERSRRHIAFWAMQALGVGFASVATISLAVDGRRSAGPAAVFYGTGALVSGVGFYVLSTETPTERVLRLYHDDPGLKLRAGVSALPSGGASFSLSGTF